MSQYRISHYQRKRNHKKTAWLYLERPEKNERVHLTIIPNSIPTSTKASAPSTPQGAKGIYHVTFVLGIPGRELFLEGMDLRKEKQSGTSLLLMPSDVSFIQVKIRRSPSQWGEAEIVFTGNREKRVSNVQLLIEASNFDEAEREAFNLVMPLLSRWSYESDVALDVKFYEIVEKKTQVQKLVLCLIGKPQPIQDNISGISEPEFRVVFAAYREATNATNPFYQLLCFYKVIEGVKKLRGKRREILLAAGKEYREPSDERIPSSEAELSLTNSYQVEAFSPYLGQKFTRVLDQLRDLLRNAVAHLDPTGNSLIADNFDDIAKCECAIPVIRYMSRVMLNNEIQADPDIANISRN